MKPLICMLAFFLLNTTNAQTFKGKKYVPLNIKPGTYQATTTISVKGSPEFNVKNKLCYTAKDIQSPSLGVNLGDEADGKKCAYVITESTSSKFTLNIKCQNKNGENSESEAILKVESQTKFKASVSNKGGGSETPQGKFGNMALEWVKAGCPENLRAKNVLSKPPSQNNEMATQMMGQIMEQLIDKDPNYQKMSPEEQQEYRQKMKKMQDEGLKQYKMMLEQQNLDQQ